MSESDSKNGAKLYKQAIVDAAGFDLTVKFEDGTQTEHWLTLNMRCAWGHGTHGVCMDVHKTRPCMGA